MNSRRAVLVPILAAFTLSACGEDKPSRAEFATQAEKICADIEKAGDSLGSPDSAKELPAFVDKATKTLDDGVSRMQKLETPDGDAGKKAEEFVSQLETDANDKLKPALQELKSAAEKEDQQALAASAEKLQKLDTSESDKLAREIGAEGCAE